MSGHRLHIDLNSDLGEGFPHDAELIALVSSINIACGGHAGDEQTMRTAVQLAKANGVNIGAHPGYEDRDNFGRVEIALTPGEVADLTCRQMRRLIAIVQSEAATLRHVKPHGALYHVVGRDRKIADAFVAAVREIDASLTIVGPPNSQLALAAEAAALTFIAEGFIDRRYLADGTLAPRSTQGSVIENDAEAIDQALMLIKHQQAIATDGAAVPVNAPTLCVHGDTPHAMRFLTKLRDELRERQIGVIAF